VKEQISVDQQTRELAWQRHIQKLNENSEFSSAKRGCAGSYSQGISGDLPHARKG
jgi:hypothetical protein